MVTNDAARLMLGIREADAPVDDDTAYAVNYELCLLVDVEHPGTKYSTTGWRTRCVGQLVSPFGGIGWQQQEAERWCDLNGYAGRLPWRSDVDDHGREWIVADLVPAQRHGDTPTWYDRLIERLLRSFGYRRVAHGT